MREFLNEDWWFPRLARVIFIIVQLTLYVFAIGQILANQLEASSDKMIRDAFFYTVVELLLFILVGT